MKLWTSYFAKIDKLCQIGFKDFVAVSGYVPNFYEHNMKDQNLFTFRRCIELAPKKYWFFDWKAGKFGNEEYIRLYNQTVLNKLDFNEIIKKFKDNSVLLCYEKSNDFCHRHLIADWITQHGIECKEVNNV